VRAVQVDLERDAGATLVEIGRFDLDADLDVVTVEGELEVDAGVLVRVLAGRSMAGAASEVAREGDFRNRRAAVFREEGEVVAHAPP
jgi:hypothetical protein